MNSQLEKLHPYPFEKLAKLKHGLNPPASLNHIALSIGEPKHTPPPFVIDTLVSNISRIANYPTTKGLPELREAICDWANVRFNLQASPLGPENNVLPVNGTREALFAFAQAIVNKPEEQADKSRPLILMPNPFYQIYEGAAFLAGAHPVFLNTVSDSHFVPDFSAVSDTIWQDCQLLYICNPGNPSGAVMPAKQIIELIKLALKFDFVIAGDECYSELYFDEGTPPTGLLDACIQAGNPTYKNCMVFHSLSKRSNLPGLRSGFVAGDERLISSFLKYRTYHGCAMPIPNQLASIAAWQDEHHVIENRYLYKLKFDAVYKILSSVVDIKLPDASFYFWIRTPIDDEAFAKQLFAEKNITVLPGKYLAREYEGVNPGEGYIRIALVATMDECVDAAHRIKDFCHNLTTCSQ